MKKRTMKTIKCNCCNQEKEEYVTGICKECADKMDKHILGEKRSRVTPTKPCQICGKELSGEIFSSLMSYICIECRNQLIDKEKEIKENAKSK